MIKRIIQELIYLATPDPWMNEYNQGNKIVMILIMIISAVMIGHVGISIWLN